MASIVVTNPPRVFSATLTLTLQEAEELHARLAPTRGDIAYQLYKALDQFIKGTA